MTAEEEISLLNKTIKEIEDQKSLLYIKDGFEKIKLVNEKAGVDSCKIYILLQKMTNNTTTKLIGIDLPCISKPDKLRNILPVYGVSHLVNGKVFAGSLNLAPLERFTIQKDTTFDDFMQHAVLSDFSKLYLSNKLENILSSKPQNKQTKI